MAPSALAADREHSRTTVTLIAVVLSFIATELPQGIVSLLSAVDQSIFERVYVPLGDLWDLLILVNSAVNFVLYCTMSRQYRQTFRRIFVDDLTVSLRRLIAGRCRCLEPSDDDNDDQRPVRHGGRRPCRPSCCRCCSRQNDASGAIPPTANSNNFAVVVVVATGTSLPYQQQHHHPINCSINDVTGERTKAES